MNGTVEIDLALDAPTGLLWMNATDLDVTLAEVTFGGRTRPVEPTLGDRDFLGFSFAEPIGPGPARLHISYTARVSDREVTGVFRQREANEWYLFTQFEATDARRAFPCFDEPGFKVPFRLSLTVKRELVALANTPVVSEVDAQLDAGWKTVRFAETRPLPSYLVAFAVGPFDLVDAGRAGVNRTALRVVTSRGHAGEGRYAVEAAVPLFEGVERLFGIPYPYEKLDLLAIPQFGGAMEHPGLVTFAGSLLLSKPEEETIAGRRSYAETYAHEVAHMWFGNLVTTAWWDDIWLNEAFASWAGPKAVDAWKPAWNEELERVDSRSAAMNADTLASARRVRQPITSNGDIANAFDGITYEKGRSVLEMFEAWLGPQTFNRGVRRYLRTHAWKNATSADFAAAISEEAGTDVGPAFSSFLDQVGVPLVAANLVCPKRGAPHLRLTQSRYLPLGSTAPGGQRWHIPICFAYGNARGRQRECRLLTEPSVDVPLATRECPTWLLPNDGMTGYFRSLPTGEMLNRLLEDGGKRLTLAERVGVVSDLRALVEGGQLAAGAVLELIPVLQRESGDNLHIVAATVAVVTSLDADVVPHDLRPNYARFVRKLYGDRARSLGWKAAPGEDEDTRLLRRTLVRVVANQGEDRGLIEGALRLVWSWLRDRRALAPDLVDVALEVAARHGGRALFDGLLAEARRVPARQREDRGRLLAALSLFEDPALVREALALFLRRDFDPREASVLLFGASRTSRRRPAAALAFQFLKAHYDDVLARLPQGTLAGTEYAASLPLIASNACDERERAEVEAFFRERAAKTLGGSRILAEVLEGIALCARAAASQRESVAAFLRQW